MNCKWMLHCCLISIIVWQLCAASIIPRGRRLAASCKIPYVDSGIMEITEHCEVEDGKICRIKCNDGLVVVDIDGVLPVDKDDNIFPLKCEDGRWNGFFRCDVPSPCSKLSGYDFPHYRLTGNCGNVKHGETCSVTCNAGFGSKDPNVFEVQLKCFDGKWKKDNSLTCKDLAGACANTSLIYELFDHHLEVISCARYQYTFSINALCSVKCKEGFQLEDPYNSEGQIWCIDGQWKKDKPITCRELKSCTTPSRHELGEHLEVTGNCELEHGKNCSVRCKDGLLPDNTDVLEAWLICNAGLWEGSFNCTVPSNGSTESKKCPALQIPNAAKDPACSESDPDQECTIICHDNFDLDGEGKIKCDSTGKWSREPKCNHTALTQPKGGSSQALTKITNNFCKNNCIFVNS